MPIIIPKELPAHDILQKENIFVMTDKRAVSQDIRPIEIAILNLMPTKIETETQLMRLLGNTPLQVKITLVKTAEDSKNITCYFNANFKQPIRCFNWLKKFMRYMFLCFHKF